MSESERANKLAQQALKLAHKKNIMGKHKHLDEAADLYTQAGNAYKIDHNWKEAGNCHMESAKILSDLNEKTEASSQAVEAAKCYSRLRECVDNAVTSYKFAADIYKEKQRKMFDAGQCLVEAANLLINSDLVQESMPLVQQAIQYFKQGTGNEPQIARCLERCADVLVEDREYKQAIEMYEQVITIRLKDQLTQSCASSVFFKLMLTYLQNGDTVGARQKIEEFMKRQPTFKNHQFYKFLNKIIEAFEERSIPQFDDCYEEFFRTNDPDPWIKNRFLDMRHFADDTNNSELL